MFESGGTRREDAHFRYDALEVREWTTADHAGEGCEDGQHSGLHRQRHGPGFLEYPISDNTDRFTALLQTCDDAEQDFLYEAMGALLNVYRNNRK